MIEPTHLVRVVKVPCQGDVNVNSMKTLHHGFIAKIQTRCEAFPILYGEWYQSPQHEYNLRLTDYSDRCYQTDSQ